MKRNISKSVMHETWFNCVFTVLKIVNEAKLISQWPIFREEMTNILRKDVLKHTFMQHFRTFGYSSEKSYMLDRNLLEDKPYL